MGPVKAAAGVCRPSVDDPEGQLTALTRTRIASIDASVKQIKPKSFKFRDLTDAPVNIVYYYFSCHSIVQQGPGHALCRNLPCICTRLMYRAPSPSLSGGPASGTSLNIARCDLIPVQSTPKSIFGAPRPGWGPISSLFLLTMFTLAVKYSAGEAAEYDA